MLRQAILNIRSSILGSQKSNFGVQQGVLSIMPATLNFEGFASVFRLNYECNLALRSYIRRRPFSAAARAQHIEYSFRAPTRRQKGPRSAMMERLGFHSVVLESLDLILEPPGTYFEPSGRCFWASQ